MPTITRVNLNTIISQDQISGFGYFIALFSIFLGAIFFSVDVIVWGHGAACLILIISVFLRFIKRSKIRLQALPIQFFYLLTSVLYLTINFPNGLYTFISILNAIFIVLLFSGKRLPCVSEKLCWAMFIVICFRLFGGYQAIDLVMLHSKNYVFIFMLFYTTAAAFENYTNGRYFPRTSAILTCLVGISTMGVANILTATFLLLLVLFLSRGVTRVILLGLVLSAVVVFYWVGGGTSEIAFLHFSGGQHTVTLMEETVQDPLGDERIKIWSDYLQNLDVSSFLLGGFSGQVDVDQSMHSSILGAHKKFGIIGIVAIVMLAIVLSSRGFFLTILGVLYGIFVFRGVFDTVAFVGSYFDFVMIGVVLAVSSERTESSIVTPGKASLFGFRKGYTRAA